MANILIVDDNKATIQHIEELLCSFGHNPLYLLESEYFFDMLDSTSVDLILLDVHMPGDDGVSLLKKVKNNLYFSSIPVIMLTGDTAEGLLETCFDLGAVDFINKPINETVLRARVKSALSIQDHILTLQKRETSLREALLMANMGSWDLDLTTEDLEWSPEMFPLFGIDPNTFRPSVSGIIDLVHLEDQERVRKFFEQFKNSASTGDTLDFRITRKDGQSRILHQQAEVILKKGKVIHIVGVTQDITDQQHTKALHQAYERQNEIREEERERIAKDLHDEVIQIFNMLKIKLNASSVPLCKDSSPQKNCWLTSHHENCQDLITTGNQVLRQIVNDLYPTVLKDLGLVAALRSHINDLNQRMDLKVNLNIGPGLEAWPLSLELTVFRVAQEALNNFVKHADTTDASVMLGQRQETLWLQIEDEGKGMDLEHLNFQKEKKSFGLFFMQERVRQIGGKFTIHSQPGQGTSIFMEIPRHYSGN